MSKRKKFIITIGVLLLLIAFSLLIIKKVKLYKVAQEGVLVEEPNYTIEKGHKIYSDWGDMNRYKVFKKQWSDLKMGDSGKTILEYGDFLCCICAVVCGLAKRLSSS